MKAQKSPTKSQDPTGMARPEVHLQERAHVLGPLTFL